MEQLLIPALHLPGLSLSNGAPGRPFTHQSIQLLLHAHPGLLLCQDLQLQNPFLLTAQEEEDDGVVETSPSTQPDVVGLSHHDPPGSWCGGDQAEKGEIRHTIS